MKTHLCPASHADEVMIVTAVDRAGSNLLGSTCKILCSLLEQRCQSWAAPGVGKEGREGRVGKQIQERPQRGSMSPQGEVSGEQRANY